MFFSDGDNYRIGDVVVWLGVCNAGGGDTGRVGQIGGPLADARLGTDDGALLILNSILLCNKALRTLVLLEQ